VAFLCELFGRKKMRRLSREAEADLARYAEMLPLGAFEKGLLRWFHGQPVDEQDFELRGRPTAADGWASKLPALLERAKKCAANRGGPNLAAAAAKGVSLSEPDGWREIFAKKYPRGRCPDHWSEVDSRVRAELLRELEGRAA
jgi:hypothetical protein